LASLFFGELKLVLEVVDGFLEELKLVLVIVEFFCLLDQQLWLLIQDSIIMKS
jgi:hypothetical protein